MFCKEFYSLVDGHVEHITDILSVETYIQNLRFEPLPMTTLARQYQVRHKLHLDGDGTLTLTFFTATSIGIETEVSSRIAHLLRKRLGGKKFPYFVPRLDVCNRI